MLTPKNIIFNKDNFFFKENRRQKGQLFSIDAIIAFLICIFMLYLILQTTHQFIGVSVQSIENIEKQRKATLLVDMLIKNSDENSCFYGCANEESQLKRIVENEISSLKIHLLAGETQNLKKYKIVNIEIIEKNGTQQLIYSKSPNYRKSCLTIERFVLYDRKKAKIFVRVCDE